MCSSSFNPLEGGYDSAGNVVCKACAEKARAQARALETKAKGSWFIGAVGAFLVSFMSFAVESRYVFFAFPVIGIGAGVAISYGAIKNQEVARALSWKRWPTVLIAAVAALLGVLSLLMAFTSRM